MTGPSHGGSSFPAEHHPGGGATSPIVEAINILRRRWGTMLAVAVLGTTAAVIGGSLLPPKYTATATLVIGPRQTRVVNVEQVLPDLPGGQETTTTELSLVRARPLVVKVMGELALFRDPELGYRGPQPSGERAVSPLARLVGPAIEAMIAGAYQLIEPVSAAVSVAPTAPAPDGSPPAASDEDMIHDFLRNLQVMQVGGTYSRLISISYRSTDPVKAAAVANRLAGAYVESQLEEKRAATSKANGWLNDRLRSLQQEVRDADRETGRFRAENQLTEVRGLALNEEQLAELNGELINVHSDVAAKEAKLRLVRELQASTRDQSSVTDVMHSPVIEALRKDEAEIERQQGDYATLYGARHPRMLALLESKAKINRRINDEITRIFRSLEDDLSVAKTRKESIERDLERSREAYVTQNQAAIRARELEREATAKRAMYQTLLARYQETKTQEGILVPDARLVSEAGLPPRPSTASLKLVGVAGFCMSLLLGSLLAFLRERLDGTVRSSGQVEGVLKLSCLGLVPKIKKPRGKPLHMQLLVQPRSDYAEALNAVYRTVFAIKGEGQPKIVMVTSALPDEGKTSLAASLAVRGAKLGKKVAVVDLDLRHPSVAREFGRSSRHDVADFLAGHDDLDTMVTRDDPTGVDVLAVRRDQENVADLLMSPRLSLLLERLSVTYDCIILDAPPVLGLVDALILSSHVDTVVFVARWARTKITAVTAALKTLEDAGVTLAGVAVTQVNLTRYARAHYGDAAEHHGAYSRYYVN